MAAFINPDHPKQKLLFFVAQALDDRTRAAVRQFVLRLASLRRWLNGPPRFVNSREQADGATAADAPSETLGGFLEIYSALPPLSLPRETDLQHLEEVTALVRSLREFARDYSLTIELELDGTFVGSITGGELDHTLAEGFLGEWRRHL